MYQLHFFCTSATFSVPTTGLFSRSRLRGTQGARLYTRRKFGPRPGSVARALGVQSRTTWQLIAGSLSAQPEPRKAIENPLFSFCVPLSHTVTTLASSFPRSYSHGHCCACVDIAYTCVFCVCGSVHCVVEPHFSAF